MKFFGSLKTVFALLLLVTPVGAQAQEEGATAPAQGAAAPAPPAQVEQTASTEPTASVQRYPDIFSDNIWGARGAYRTQGARPLFPGALVMSLSDNYASSSSMLVQGDSNVESTLGITLLWALPYLEGFEVGLNQISTINKYTDILTSTLQLQGNPSLLLKYTAPMMPALSIGGTLVWTVPTSAGGNGLDTAASTLKLQGIASYRVHEYVDIHANLGYIFDNSSQLFVQEGTTPTALQRFVYGINSHTNRAAYAIAGVGEFNIKDVLGVDPYLEFSGEYTGALSAGQNPFLATLGVKAFPWKHRIVEGQIGVDMRLGGEPRLNNATTPGLPGWLIFAQLGLHMGDTEPMAMAPICNAHMPCAPHHQCEEGVCVALKEVTVEKLVEKEVAKPQATVALVGGVFDAESGQPIGGAEVTVAGQKDPLTVNSNTGKFAVCPLPADGGLVRLTAHALGYVDDQQTVTRSTSSADKPIAFHLRATGNPVIGTFKGSVRDGSTGKPIPNVAVFVPAASLKVPVQEDGSFDVTLKVGRYQVLVSAPDYETQKKEVQISSDQVVIVDIDLLPRSGHGAVKSLKTQTPSKKKKK